ncbi:hypothetical protein TSAR_007979 [Trichomalopsis sarcophagae]|uniref:Uncharacterized protein n=1 Tax=Trichomalopsis sarcophagae TaxID=543379 RepID=A0A232FNH3_9HYME|nr:hypothetical protein TSAR_007979 [Trichomalopsis sarcophagae]
MKLASIHGFNWKVLVFITFRDVLVIVENEEIFVTIKILDPDLSPLGFDASRMYNFVAKRFNNTNAKVQEQALNWLQTLTLLGITIPLPQLFSMFSEGILDSKKVDSTNLTVAENILNGLNYKGKQVNPSK